ncbi:hypothetical protein MAHJHV57_52220 [Mycobacterium avium subsp. hominissuis]
MAASISDPAPGPECIRPELLSGAGSLMDAAKAWGVLGAQLADTALTYRAVIAVVDARWSPSCSSAITAR